MKTFFILILLSACSFKKDRVVSPDEYMDLNKAHAPQHKICLEQKKTVLEKAIQETEDAELDDETYFFVRNEKKALEFMQQLDLTKFTLKQNQMENEALINACVTDINKAYKNCDSLMPAYKYMRGLIYGLRQYQWSTATKKIAVDQLLAYLNYVAQSESSLMDVMLGNDLLMRMSNLGFVEGKFFLKTIDLRVEGEDAHKDLKKRIRKLKKKELTCKDAQEFYKEERENVVKLSKKFSALLGEIK